MGEKQGRASSRIDALLVSLSRLAKAGISYLPLLLAGPVLGASVYWFLLQPPAQLKLLDTNKLTLEQQLLAARPVFVAVGVVAFVLLAAYIVLTKRRGIPFATIASKIGGYLTPFLAVPFVVALMQAGLEKESPKLTLFFGVVIAGIIGAAAYRIGRGPAAFTMDRSAEDVPSADVERRQRLFGRIGSIAAWACVLGMWAAYGWFFTKLSITNHHAMVTRTIDLGLYDNIFYQSAHGRPLDCTFIKAGTHLSAHFDPILVILSPLYRLYPRAEFILGLQSVWIGSGVIPVFLLARHHLKSRLQGVMLAAVYALHPAIHGANMYEFHSLSLATVPVMWTLFALQAGRLKLYWAMLAVSLLVREDIPLMLSMVGVTCLILPGGNLRKTGLATIVICASYFVIVKAFFMTSAGVIMSGPEAYSYAYYYSEMIPPKSGMGGMVLTLITNPSFVVRHALEEAKLLYLAKLFLPLLLVPFATRSWRLTLAYGLAFTLLATREAVFSPAFQYSTALLPFAFAAVPIGIRQLSEGTLARAYNLNASRVQRGLVFAALAGSMAITYKFGAIVDNQAFKGGFSRVVRTLTPEQQAHYNWLEETKTKIPPKVSLGVTNKMGPHVSNRKDVFLYGQKNVQWVLVDEKELKKDRLKRHKQAIDQGKLEEVARRGTYALFKFGPGKPKVKEPIKPEPEEGAEDEDVTDVLGDDPHE